MHSHKIRQAAIKLREDGRSYSEINLELNQSIPKGTIAYWVRNVTLSEDYRNSLRKENLRHLRRARILANKSNEKKRRNHFAEIIQRNKHLSGFVKSTEYCIAI